MRKGDCRGALDAFDGVLRVTFDPTVVRDRGICNEKLGYPFPAMDDYRAYLTERPDAADADAIREKLARLEGADADKSDSPEAPDTGSAQGPKDPKGAAAAAGADEAPPDGEKRDKLDFDSHDDSVYTSPLRAGTGLALYPFFAEHKWAGGSWLGSTDGSFGDPATWSEAVGLGVRYSFDPSGSLVVEAGYEAFNGTDAGQLSMSAFTSLVAYEWRFRMNPAYDQQLFLAPGVGYEHLGIGSSDPSITSSQQGGIVPRVRFGYRKMIGHSTAFDVSFDAGITKPMKYSSSTLFPAGDPTLILLAANIAFVWGM
jgi:hypothetical protein